MTDSNPPPHLAPDEARRAARDARPIPPPVPAYLPGSDTSPLTVDRQMYDALQAAPRVKLQDFTVPIRSGKAWKAPAGAIVRISTPEGPQVGRFCSICLLILDNVKLCLAPLAPGCFHQGVFV